MTGNRDIIFPEKCATIHSDTLGKALTTLSRQSSKSNILRCGIQRLKLKDFHNNSSHSISSTECKIDFFSLMKKPPMLKTV